MTSKEIRRKYLEFFRTRGHAVIPSAPLIPENDPTTLFTSSGMQPLVPYLLGQEHPEGVRLVNSQKCFRAEDIEEAGDNRHTTFFEMLGNWSLGDYGREEQLPWFFDFLTKEVGIPAERISVTCFEGDETLGLPRDTVAADIWKQLGIPEDRIHFYPAKKNWWSRSGTPDKMPVGEPGGPDSEVFYDFGKPHDTKFGETCHPNCDCGRFVEIGNSVFMEYKRGANGFEKLPRPNIDFGGGLERIAAASIDSPDIFQTDLFTKTIESIEKSSGKKYSEYAYPMRIIADHLRGVCFMAGAGIIPSNTEQGYIMRRLLRRAIRYADSIELAEGRLTTFVEETLAPFIGVYDDVIAKKEEIELLVRDEEAKFRLTLERGMKHFKSLAGSEISGQDTFILFTTYGFPIEITEELAKEQGKTVDRIGYELAMKAHQDLSRSGALQKFKGGLADQSEKTIQYHTAHHILLKALQKVLGSDVHQRGSNITGERLRIDFSYGTKMTPEQKLEVEKIVNEQIRTNITVNHKMMAREVAEKLGAEHEFGAKYPDMVSVYTIGDSIEFCGGPHVSNTSEIAGTFRIMKEEAVAAGIRRIKAVLY
ncbi:MAG: alanine--tRNA ligase [Candidatus Paceibacterota bacterium]|jgi:alanyl-tRNA synthetase